MQRKPTYDQLEGRIEALTKENDLLKLFFWDAVGLRAPDAHTTSPDGVFCATLYRCTTGAGGYVVIKQFDGNGIPQIAYLDDLNGTKWPAQIAIIANRFRIARKKICDEEAQG